MRIAITGGTGFIGRHLLRAAGQLGCSVKALARPARVGHLAAAPGVTPVPGDLSDSAALCELVAGCDAVIHLAGAIRGRSREDFLRDNLQGTRRLLDAIARVNPNAHLVNVSSLAAREPRLSWYAESKAAAEVAVVEGGKRWTTLRPPVVYGPDDPALAPLWRALARGWLPVMGSADNRFSLVHVDDLARVLLELAALDEPLQASLTLHDGEPGGYDWRKVAALASEVRGRPVRTLVIPATLLKTLAAANLALSRCYRQPPILVPGKARELVHHDWFCDNGALLAAIGWEPGIRLHQALASLPGWK